MVLNSCIQFSNLLNHLSDQQKERIENLGLGSMLKVPAIPTFRGLIIHLAKHYHPTTRSFLIRDQHIPLTTRDVHCIMGLKDEGIIINKYIHKKIPKSHLQHQFEDPKHYTITLDNLEVMIKRTKDNDDDFVRGFVLMMIGAVLATNCQRTVNYEYLNVVECIPLIQNLNWAEFTISVLHKSLSEFRKSGSTKPIEGSLGFLVLFYMEHFRMDLGFEMTHSHPLMSYWDEDKIRKREVEDHNHGRCTGTLLQVLGCPDLETDKSTAKEGIKRTPKNEAEIKFDIMLELLKSIRSNVLQFADKCCNDISLFEQKFMDVAWHEDADKANSPPNEGSIFNEIDELDLTHPFCESASTETPKQVEKREIYPGKGETKNKSNKVTGEHEPSFENKTPDKILKTRSGRVLKQHWIMSESSPFLCGNDSRKRKRTTSIVDAQALQTLGAIEIAAIQYVRNNMPDNRELVRMRTCNIFDDDYGENSTLDFLTLTAKQMVSLTSEDKANIIDNYVIDDIINCYMRIMSEGKNRRPHIHMVDTIVVLWLMQLGRTYNDNPESKTENQWVRIAKTGNIFRQCEMIFLPINRNNNHWYLGVLNFKRKEFQILDSMDVQVKPETYDKETNDLRFGILLCLSSTLAGQTLAKLPEDITSWPVEIIHDIPKQSDSISCGLFCLKYMQLWDGSNIKRLFSQADVDLFRKNLVAELIFSDLNVTEEVQRVRGDIISLSKRNV